MNVFKKAANRMRKSFSKYLEQLAKTNERQFGSSRLDCCNLQKRKGDKIVR